MCAEKFEAHACDMQGVFINYPWNRALLDSQLQKLKKLRLSKKFIRSGIVFIWAEKEIIAEIVQFFEAQDFKYVENLIVAQFSRDKLREKSRVQEISSLGKRQSILNFFAKTADDSKAANSQQTTAEKLLDPEYLDQHLPNIRSEDIIECFHADDAQFFASSKKTLLMFRRVDDSHCRPRTTRASSFDTRGPQTSFSTSTPKQCTMDSTGKLWTRSIR